MNGAKAAIEIPRPLCNADAPALFTDRVRPREALVDTIRILIADDHPLVLGALSRVVARAVEGARIVEAGDFDGLMRSLDEKPPMDLVLLDLRMPGVRGLSGLIWLRAQHPAVPVLVISGLDDHDVMRRCLELGASGYLPKSLDHETMSAAIRTVLDGGRWAPADLDPALDEAASARLRQLSSLTPQQARVLMMLSEGLLNKQIAFKLSVSEATVKAHVSAILIKLGVESRTQAVIAAAQIDKGAARIA